MNNRPPDSSTADDQQERRYSLLQATLESTADGIVATDAQWRIIHFNQRYVSMWRLEPALVQSREHRAVVERISGQLEDPTEFIAGVQSIYEQEPPETLDILKLKDGRVIERFSKQLKIDAEVLGRVWSFRDITRITEIERTLREETAALDALNKTGAALLSTFTVDHIVQMVTDAATQLITADFGAFFYNRTDEHGDSYMLYALSGVPREAFSKFPLPRATSLFGTTFRGEGTIRADDILQHPHYGRWEPHRGMPPGHLPVRSYLAVPVISRSGVVHGGLFFGAKTPGIFTERHERLVTGMASYAALAIDTANLLAASDQSKRDLEQLNRSLEQRIRERTDELLQSERQFRQLVEGVKDYAIYMLDPRGNIRSWNPGIERIKGYTATEVIGRHFGMFYTEEDRRDGKPGRALEIAVQQGKFESEGWRMRKDGSQFWAGVLIDPIRDESGNLVGFAKVTRDMSERRTLQEQLNQSQKMEAIGQLTGGVAHDFNNLLTVIIGNLDTIWRNIPNDNGRLRRATDQAQRGAQRAATLTQQLLAFSRRQPLNPRPTDLNRLVSSMSDLIRRTLTETISIETVLAAGLWPAEVDQNQLESALINLAVNSRDAMPQGGKLTIETANAHLDEAYAAQYAEITPGQYVLLCVTDTGEGMSASVLERAFDPFFTTKPIGQGTGLGLSQVYGFVKQSGGHVKLYSEVGQGTTVKIYLPRLQTAINETIAERPPIVPRGSSDEVILVAEDDEDVRGYSVESLRDLGFAVLEAADGATALELLGQHPEVQLLFTDVGLPDLTGRQLVDEARRRRPDLKVLFTTGYARNAIVHQGRLDAGVDLLTKPFNRTQLASRIRDVLDAEPRYEPSTGRRALIVGDEGSTQTLLVRILRKMGYETVIATNAERAWKEFSDHGPFDVSFVNIGLSDRNGLDLAADIRSANQNTKVVITSGYGQQARGRLSTDTGVQFIGEPYDAEVISMTLDRLFKIRPR